jgi:uncharacterized membrane protein
MSPGRAWLLGLLALSLPVTGMALVGIVGWPLSQTWLLLSSVLFVVLMVVGLLLTGRLGAWQALDGAPAPKRLLGFCAAYAGVIMLLLLVIRDFGSGAACSAIKQSFEKQMHIIFIGLVRNLSFNF